jgi:hypothetical protein
MTVDINEYEQKKSSDIKPCETCKCLTCKSGKMFNGTNCDKGKNCSVCNGEAPVTECDKFVSGF